MYIYTSTYGNLNITSFWSACSATRPNGSALCKVRIHIQMHIPGVSIGCLSGVGALWDCVPRVCGGGGGCAVGGVPLGAVPVLSWSGEVSRGLTSPLSLYINIYI